MTKLAMQIYGPETGRRFLAVHGWLDNAASFATLAPLLPELRIAALDLPGHGHSAHRSVDASYHFVDWLTDIDRAAGELGWERFSLLGHSLGAAVATLYTGAFPERIERLVNIEGLAPLTSPDAEMPARVAQHIAAMRTLKEKRTPVYQTVEQALAARAAAGDFARPELVRPIVERGLRPVSGGYTWRSDPRLKLPSSQQLTHAQAGAFFECITCPVLTLRASRGIPIKPEDYEDYCRRIRRLKLVGVEGGHHVHLEEPERIAREIQAWLDAPA